MFPKKTSTSIHSRQGKFLEPLTAAETRLAEFHDSLQSSDTHAKITSAINDVNKRG